MRRAFKAYLAACAGLGLLSLSGLALAQAGAGDAARGQAVFDDRCGMCHSLTDNLQGPRLGGVVGRKAGTVAGVDYTDAMKGSGITWTPDRLDPFLADPAKLVPGTAMPISVPDAKERADLIAYLASTHAP
jgi:cytochrome c